MMEKPTPIRLVDLGLVPPWKTQAYYHALADLMTIDSPDTIILCTPESPYLCLGYHQPYEEIFNPAVCKHLGLSVYRRRVGGGATYLDSNQLFYQCIFHHKRVPLIFKDVYAQALAGPVAVINRLGLDGRLRAINEVEANGRRIAGIGGGRIGQASVVVGNFLFDFNYETMTKVWQVPWEPFRDLAGRALRERVTTLKHLLDEIDPVAIQAMLIEEFETAYQRPLEVGEFTEAEHAHAQHWAEKMESEEYLYLHAEDQTIRPMTALKIAGGVFIHAAQTEIDGQTAQVSFLVIDNVITETHVAGEAAQDWSKIEMALVGAPFDQWQAYLP